MPRERQAVDAGTSHVGAEGGGMSDEPILWCLFEWECLRCALMVERLEGDWGWVVVGAVEVLTFRLCRMILC